MNFSLFITFLRIGLFTLGGGYAMLPLVQNAVCREHEWITEDDFLDVIAIVNSLPGMLATNSSGFIGYRLRGIPGFITAILGCITPSIVIILILAGIFTSVADNVFVQAFFKGVRPCIVVIMANAVYTLGKKVDFKKIYNIIAFAVSFIAIAFFGVTSLYLVILAIIVSLIMYASNAKKIIREEEHDS